MEESSEIREKGRGEFDGYHDYRQLFSHGRSAIGTVSAHGRRWFVKSLLPQFAGSSAAKQSLRKEFDILLSLNHPGIVRAIQFAEIPGVGPSIIMEYLDGQHLDEAVKDMNRSQRRNIALQLLDALEYLHSKEITHGDLKPENIIVGGPAAAPHLTLIDFNIADSGEYTVDKEAGGNRRYAAPEQFDAGYRLAPPADVYSVALILKDLRLGAGWLPTLRKSLATNPARRLQDAGAIKRHHSLYGRRILLLASLILFLLIAFFLTFLFTTTGEKRDDAVATLDTAALPSEPQLAEEEASGNETTEIIPSIPDTKVEPKPGSASQQPPELAKLEPQKRKAEAEIEQLIAKKRKEIQQILADSSLSDKNKKTPITIQLQEFIEEYSKVHNEVYFQIPSNYLMNPPEKWRDFISSKEYYDFINWVGSVMNNLDNG